MKEFYIDASALSWREEDSIKGKSDQNVINNIILDFLHSPYRSHEDPLDLLFMNQTAGTLIKPFSVGISVGSAKSMAALGILYTVTAGILSTEEIGSIASELMALTVINATIFPAQDTMAQVSQTIGKKIRVSDRTRPNPIQIEFAFNRVVKDKVSKGDRRKHSTILADVIKQYNKPQVNKCKLTSDERTAVMRLSEQVPEFKELLKAHWRNFPVAQSAVPTSDLAFDCLSDTFEPSMKKTANALHHAIWSPSKEKNVAWLRRCIGKFLHGMGELNSSGKAFTLRSACHTLRAGNDQALAFGQTAIFVHFENEVKGKIGQAAYDELLEKLCRGGLDRELMEKAKAQDPNLEIGDFRFVQAAMTYDPNAGAPGVSKVEQANDHKMASELKLDLIVLKAESDKWAEYLRKLRAFNADSHNAKTSHIIAVEEAWSACADQHLKSFFPTYIVKDATELLHTVNGAMTTMGDAAETMRGDLYKVIVINTSYMSTELTSLRNKLKTFVESLMSNDEIKTCALIVAPTVGEYKHAYEDESVEKVSRDILDDFRDSTVLQARIVTFLFDEATMYSETRPFSHQVFMCISKEVEKVPKVRGSGEGHVAQPVSAFAKSLLWVRGGVPEFVKVLPRSAMINPTTRISTGEAPCLSKAQERKQWITGPSFYGTLAKYLWEGTHVNATNTAVWLDAVPYDGHLPMALLSRFKSNDNAPREH